VMTAYVELHIGESSYWQVRTPLPHLPIVMIPLPSDQSPFSAAVASAESVVVLVAIIGCEIVFPSTPGGIRAAWVFLKPKRCERLERARQQALRRARDILQQSPSSA